jgi:hypothetical protein
MTLSALGIFSAAGAGGAVGDYELIETTILGTGAAEIIFSSLATYASTYKHLQIRLVARTNRAAVVDSAVIQFNGDNASNYNRHVLQGDGSSVSSFAETGASGYVGRITGDTATANSFAPAVAEILDAYSSTKNTTVRSLTGYHNSTTPQLYLTSTLWRNTASLTSIRLLPNVGTNFVAGSRFSLYGIR